MKNLFTIFVLGFALSHCVTTSPPLVGVVGKMPEIVEPQRKEVRASYGLDALDFSVYQLSGSYGFAPRWQFDIGTMAMDAINRNDTFEAILGSVGVKYGLLAQNRWSIALPFGLGAGCGGFNGDDDEDVHTTYTCDDGFAIGGYTGIDFGYRFGKVVGVYQGNRFQLSKAEDLPLSFIPSLVLGMQFDLHKNLFASVEGGYAWTINEVQSADFSMMAFTLGVRW